jgi:hypothetical protein
MKKGVSARQNYGKKLGKIVLPFNKSKSLEGTLFIGGPNPPFLFLSPGQESGISSQPAAEDRCSSRNGVAYDHPRLVCLGFQLQPDSEDVSARPLGRIFLFNRDDALLS